MARTPSSVSTRPVTRWRKGEMELAQVELLISEITAIKDTLWYIALWLALIFFLKDCGK